MEGVSRLSNSTEEKLLEIVIIKGGTNEVNIDILCITPIILRYIKTLTLLFRQVVWSAFNGKLFV